MRPIRYFLGIFFALWMLQPPSSLAESFHIQLHEGVGKLSSSEQTAATDLEYSGGRLLLNSSTVERYGLEYSQFRLNSRKDFRSVGIILEKSVAGWLMISIGTIGYFNYSATEQNVPGLVSEIGWDPTGFKSIRPRIVGRQDLIFDVQRSKVYSLSLGVSFVF